MAAALPAMEPASPFSFGGLIEFICEAFFGRATDEPVVVPVAQKLSAPEAALFRRLWSLAQPVLAAKNVPELRQALGDVALSPEYAQWEIGCYGVVGPDALDHLKELSQTRPIRPVEALLHHLGPDVADLLAQAFDLLLETIEWEPDPGSESPSPSFLLPERLPPPADLARVRRRLVLGDVLSAGAASVVLASLRGQIAFLALLCAVFEDEKIPNWKGIALGELAVAGMQSFQRLVLPTPEHLDLAVEEQKYAAFKADLVASLMQDGDAP